MSVSPGDETAEPRRRRRGRHREPVLAILRGTSPLSAQDVYAALRGSDAQIGLSTAYRELHALAREGIVDVARIGDETVYAVRGDQPIDLIVCILCDRTVQSARDQRLTAALTTAGLLDVERHPVVVQGRCRDCSIRTAELGTR